MARRIIMCLIGVALVTGLVAGAVTAATAGITEGERTAAITAGLAWLSAAQTPGGYFEDPAHPGYYPVALTALAVLKFEDEAARNDMSAFDPKYPYYAVVQKAWEYLSQNAHVVPLSVQVHVNSNDDPDPDIDGGVCFYSTAGATVYETGIVMMALQASGQPNGLIPGWTVVGYPNLGTFRNVLQDCVDWVAWAQTDSGSGEGGWKYVARDNAAGESDNSASQWPVLGLMAAEVWNINAPAWVKSELLIYWLAATQQPTSSIAKPGCFGYSAATTCQAGAGYFATSAAGLVELSYCGVLSNAPQWSAGVQCICHEWDALPPTGNIGNLYAMYGLMKAAMLARPVPVWTFCEHEWQPEYDRWIVDNQTTNGVNAGSWSADYALPWLPGSANAVLSTEYALLILQKTVPGKYDPLASFEDLLKEQADRLASFESLLNVCWRNLERVQQLEFLRSFEDLLHSQAAGLESFEDLLNAAIGEFSAAQQVVFLRSFEDLLRRQADRLESFEDLLKAYNAADQPALQMYREEGEK